MHPEVSLGCENTLLLWRTREDPVSCIVDSMASHYEKTLKAATKVLDEQKKLQKEIAKVKTAEEKKKLADMIEACYKMAVAYKDMLTAAADKDRAEMKQTLEKITLRKM